MYFVEVKWKLQQKLGVQEGSNGVQEETLLNFEIFFSESKRSVGRFFLRCIFFKY